MSRRTFSGGGQTARILVLRFSALGDVALLAPLLIRYARAYPQVRWMVAGPRRMGFFFRGVENLEYMEIDKRAGFWNIYRRLRSWEPTAVADLHSVLRSLGLRCLFFLSHGCDVVSGRFRVVFLHKGRCGRRRLCRKANKVLSPLPSMLARYKKTLERLGYGLPPHLEAELDGVGTEPYWKPRITDGRPPKVGLAPFASFAAKEYPLHLMEQVVEALYKAGVELYFFGGGERERQIAEQWQMRFEGARSLVGKYGFEKEMEVLGGMDLVLCMDSANAHFASCLGVPAVTVWGSTHPYAGFYAWRQDPAYAVQRTDLKCRPCSVFGNQPCHRGDYACLNIEPAAVVEKVLQAFSASHEYKK